MNDGYGSGSGNEEKRGNGYRKRVEVDDGRWIRERIRRRAAGSGVQYIEDRHTLTLSVLSDS